MLQQLSVASFWVTDANVTLPGLSSALVGAVDYRSLFPDDRSYLVEFRLLDSSNPCVKCHYGPVIKSLVICQPLHLTPPVAEVVSL